MKKLLAILISIVMILTLFVSCGPKDDDNGPSLPGTEDSGSNDQTSGETPDDGDDAGECGHYVTKTTGAVAPTCTAAGYSGDKSCYACGELLEAGSQIAALGHTFVKGVCSVCGDSDPDYNGDVNSGNHDYNVFTATEKSLFNERFGFVIPFIANDEYYVEEYEYEDEVGLNFYTYGNTEAEFEAYLALFGAYESEGSDVDDYGDTWYFFSNDGAYIDVSYYYYESDWLVDVYVYYLDDSDGGDSGDEDDGDEDDGEILDRIYIGFTADEKELFNEYFGFVIPFIPNDFYYVEDLAGYDLEGLNFYTYDNTKAEFNAYLQLFADYTNEGTEVDEYGDTWYLFTKGDVCIDIAYYYYDDSYIVDVYVYYAEGTTGGSGDNGGDSGSSDHTYTGFTSSEKELFNEYFGFVIPFIPNDYYYVDDLADYDIEGINFYTFDNTTAEFNAYLKLFASYTNEGTEVDEYGDTWYLFSKGDVYIDIAYYEYEGSYVVDVYVYYADGTTGGSSDNGGTDDDNSGSTDNTYTDFTSDEKALFNEYFGFVIPFLSNTEYYVYDLADYGIEGINFYTCDNTIAEFNAYLQLFANYTNEGTEVDEYGDTWYLFSKGDVCIDVAYYEYESSYIVDVYVYYADETTDGSGDNGGTDDDNSGSTDNTYTDFTSDEKALFNEYFGFVIPFIANDEYYVEEYEYEDEIGLHFYTYGNTEAEFEAYLALFASYYNNGTGVDEYGDTWYFFGKDGCYVDMCYYLYEGYYVVDVYAYYTNDNGSSGDSGSDDNDDNGGNNGSISNDSLITNDGAGLPTDEDGVYDIDFTDAEYVKDVTDMGYYIDGCPTTGSPAVLVIPVQFSDIKASTKGYTIEGIENAFLKDGVTDYYSVYDYYYISSYGQLTLDITILDSWFTTKYNSSYYANYYDSDGYFMGDQLIMDEALAYLAGIMDLSDFDSDDNGIIDAVVFINCLDVGDDDFHWAYRYWNYYMDKDGYYYEYDGVSANDYLWASYQFLQTTDNQNGEVTYDNVNGMDTYTFIHEIAHVLGADDYYNTAYGSDPLDGYDVMDNMKGDHNAFTKINLGWITTSRLVVTDDSVTLTLEDFSKNGDTIIIANNWDPDLGAYQEYYIIMYYTNNGLNGNENGYFTRDGIVVYHINASLCYEEYDGEKIYDIYNNNTDSSDQYGTKDNLIEFVKSTNGTYTYVAGDKIPTVTLDGGETLHYTFTVVSFADGVATITFEKI